MYHPGGQPHPQYIPGYPPVQSMNVGPTSHSSNTNVIINQPQGAGAGGYSKPRPWNAGLCGCCDDIGSCLCVWCCTYCYLMYLASKLEEECFIPMCVYYTLPALRLKLRTRENIEGSILKDCCAVHCCAPCVMCQIKREMNAVTQIQAKVATYHK